MAIVNVSLDTKTRQMVLTVNGIIVPFYECSVSRWVDGDGEEHINFSYTIEIVNSDGLSERRQFILPSLEEIAVNAHKINDDGFASKIVYNDDKAKADVIEFFSKEKKS